MKARIINTAETRAIEVPVSELRGNLKEMPANLRKAIANSGVLYPESAHEVAMVGKWLVEPMRAEKMKCPVCGRAYEIDPDDPDPRCLWDEQALESE